MIPDMAGVARGKIIPRSKFETGENMRLPLAVMVQTVTGDYPKDGTLTGVTDPDMICVPDPSNHAPDSLGGRPDRPGHPRRRAFRRHAGRDLAALRAAQGARTVSRKGAGSPWSRRSSSSTWST
ncbi:MAG: hypothetical protein WDN30_11750 [Pararobbsia sp.]